MPDEDRVPLADMIEMLREELQSSIERGAGKQISFDIEKVELELKVAVTNKVKGQAGIAFWVLTAGGGGERSSNSGHTFKLTLLPVLADSKQRVNVRSTTRKPVSDR